MSVSKAAPKGGLEGIVAGDSAIGYLDGEKGELRYCGYLIKDLADHSNFVETVWLLWHLELPNKAQLEELRTSLLAERALPGIVYDVLKTVAQHQEPMDALRTAVSAMSADDVPGEVTDRRSNLRRGIRLTAKFPTIIAAHERLRQGKKPLEPRSDLSHAGNFLYMLTGEVPHPEEERMFDTCLVLHAEHGFNASTFAARVTAATLADLYAAITSAIGTLKGPLHGGANTAVMQMLLEMGSVANVEPYLDRILARGGKVMGFGHRVYKVMDPRALILKDFSQRLAKVKNEPRWYEMSAKLEALMKARKGIDVNVDFFSASTYYYMGIRPELYTTIFALSRIAGWVAHVLEQYGNNRLIRPEANWIGAAPRPYVPLGQR
ncbi:MAG: citrate synthase [Planctomycetes bacterium]|nr:citrate synthase [Planctomycetota bacterium]